MDIVIETDGGSRGNPGPAGSGAVLKEASSGEVLESLAYVVGTNATNNEAEYQGLLCGLETALGYAPKSIQVRMDSKLVVEQMSGRWKIKKAELQQLASRCQALAREVADISYEWIPRAKNARADELANLAMDAVKAGVETGYLPEYAPKIAQEANKETAPALHTPGSASTAKPEQTATQGAQAWNGATAAATRFVLLRHGQTPMSAQKLYSGRSDPELSAIGKKQAAAAAHYLGQADPFDVIVCSPARRCQQTAQAVQQYHDAPLRLLPDLWELDFGQWEGKSFQEASAADPELHRQWLSDPELSTPKGESVAEVHRRVQAVREDLMQEFGEARILVVSHVTPIKSFLSQALDTDISVSMRLHLDLASISVADFYADGPSCVSLMNETSYYRQYQRVL